jgi:hypothetical protein
MAETTEIISTEKAAPSPKKGKATKAKKPRTVPSHPKTSDMVNAAITNLKERGGSSLQAIKKYVAATYKVDVEKLSPFIKKYLKSAVTSGALVQTKGKGASGSFKLSGGKSEKRAEGKKTKKASPKKAAKASPAKKSKPSAAVKTAKPKKKSAVKPAATPKKASAGKKKVTPSAAKPKKAAKSPKAEKKAKVQKKPKSPKPKKAVKKASGKK